MTMIDEQPGELRQLIQAQQKRPLSDKERARLAWYTFTPDAELERARHYRDHAPSLFRALPAVAELTARLEAYERKRAEALEAGRQIAPLPAAWIAEVDELLPEFEATREVPAELRDPDAARAEFVASAREDGLGARTMAAWRAWTARREAEQEFMARRAGVRSRLGLAGAASSSRPRLSLLREFAAAVGDPAFDPAWR